MWMSSSCSGQSVFSFGPFKSPGTPSAAQGATLNDAGSLSARSYLSSAINFRICTLRSCLLLFPFLKFLLGSEDVIRSLHLPTTPFQLVFCDWKKKSLFLACGSVELSLHRIEERLDCLSLCQKASLASCSARWTSPGLTGRPCPLTLILEPCRCHLSCGFIPPSPRTRTAVEGNWELWCLSYAPPNQAQWGACRRPSGLRLLHPELLRQGLHRAKRLKKG